MGRRLTHLARERGLRSSGNSLGKNRASFLLHSPRRDGLGDWCLLTAQTWEERRPRQGSRQGSWGPATTKEPSSSQGKVIPLQPSWLSLSPQGAVIKLDPYRAVKDGNERGGDEQQPGREGPLSPARPERRQCLFRLDSGQALPSYSLLAL